MPITATVAVIAAAAAAGSGILQSEAQRKTANKNRDAQERANELAYQRWLESRGLKGNALFPLYAPPGMEKKGLEDAFAYYNTLGMTPPAELMQKYQAIIDSEQANVAAGDRLITDIFTGKTEQDALAQQAPVAAARMNLAQTGREGLEAARAAQEASISAQEAAKGYIGTGNFAQNRRAAAVIPYYQQAAGKVSTAELENALEVAKIQEAQRQMRIGSINMPIQRANQKVSMAQLPAQATAAYAGLQQTPLNFWKMESSPPPPITAYQSPVVESPWGAALSGLAAGAGTYGAMSQNQAAMNMAQRGQDMNAGMYNEYMAYLRSQNQSPAPLLGPGY